MLTGNEKHLKISDLVETDQTVVAEQFADYFLTMALNGAARNILKLKKNDFDTHVCIQAIRSAVSTITGIKPFSFNKIHPAEVQKALNELNPRKVSGHDKISPRILKLLSNELVPSLSKIFNTATESLKWPEDWKRDTWTPVFKKEDKQDASNYRPITYILY